MDEPKSSNADTSSGVTEVIAFERVLEKVWRAMLSQKFPGVSMAVGTIAIALFTGATWFVILGGSGDTRKVAAAADRFATAAGQMRMDLQQAVMDNQNAVQAELAQGKA